MRIKIHYLVAALILTIYGTQVCPFLETLAAWQLAMPIFIGLVIQYLIHLQICGWLHKNVPLKHRASRLFFTELTLFFTSGVLLMVFNLLYYGFPLESGIKLVVGLGFIGFYVAIDLALDMEYAIFRKVAKTGESIEPGPDFMPVSKKIAWFASLSVIVIISVVFLIINKDLDWLMDASMSYPLEFARRAIMGEFIFVIAVFIPYQLIIIAAFARNLRFFLHEMTRLMEQTGQGSFDARVPVGSNDEFGLVAQGTNRMVENLMNLTTELGQVRDVTIRTMAILAETRDNETGQHILRTQYYVKALADHLSMHPSYCDCLDGETCDLLLKSTPLHDIGKIGIPDSILLKPGRHTSEEFEIMKGHVLIGADAIRKAEEELGENSFLHIARQIAEGHHEKWDGSGYPKGLIGDETPLPARLMALADVYDALISKRVYKPAYSHNEARDIIVGDSGIHFDPDIVKAFCEIEDQFVAIAQQYSDGFEVEGERYES